MASTTKFLNVDIDLRTQNGIEAIVNAFGNTILVLNRTDRDLTFELNRECVSPDETILCLIGLVQSLPDEAMTEWNACEFRRINIGIQAGSEPHEARFMISNRAVSLLTTINCEIVITVYAAIL
jgi:hypothetical protein